MRPFPRRRKKENLVNVEETKRQGVALIKRFTGGGTVVLDHNSILVSLICEVRWTAPHLHPQPHFTPTPIPQSHSGGAFSSDED